MDDGYPDHPKVIALSDAAFRLHVRLMCYAAKHLTDGFIPTALATKARPMSELVEAHLLELSVGGWKLHDYHDWNPTAEKVKCIRRERAKAGAKGGSK